MQTLRGLLSNIAAAVLVTAGVAATQVALQLFAIAYLYADLILPPADFASSHMYDAFSQIYLLVRDRFGFPAYLDRFIGQGIASKLAILDDLIAMNGYIAWPFAIALGAGATALRLDRRRFGDRLLPLLGAVIGIELLIHFSLWYSGIEAASTGSFVASLKNYGRNFVYGGTFLACGLLALTTAIGFGVLRALRSGDGEHRGLATAAAAAGCVLALSPLPIVAAIPEAPSVQLDGQREALAPGYNIILVSIDSLRADHMSAYGYERETTPTMRTLSAAGVRFANAHSTTSWTLPAHMSMMTGRSLLGHGVISDDRSLTDDVPTLAEELQKIGYTTGAVTSAPYLEARYGFDRGFDHYDDDTIAFATNEESYKSVTAPLVQTTAENWIKANRDKPFFLFLHYWDVHYDYAPGPPYDTMFDPDYEGDINGENFYFNPKIHERMAKRDLEHVIALYDGEIRLVDDHISKLIRTLSWLGLDGKTILMVTSDHGDEFFEHGHKGHHRTLYEEMLHVPLILYVPGVQPTARVVNMETSIIDIMPTLMSLVGSPIPRGTEGVDLTSVAYRGDREWERGTQGELYRRGSLNVQVSLQQSGKKIIQEFTRLRMQAYNLSEDPDETVDRPTRTGFATALANEMTGWLNGEWNIFTSRLRSGGGVNELQMDKATREKLKSLGYLE